ncbi:hypothetical protein, partial [uncultured Dubosiella sp.]|uniref:hypothetical protein n=1 Tax=uncultured Dubosiella sp. TaxID=1937011 RepID=UPI002618B188
DLPVNSRMLYRLSYSGNSLMPVYNTIYFQKRQTVFLISFSHFPASPFLSKILVSLFLMIPHCAILC